MELLKVRLKASGYEVIVAHDGEKGIEEANKHNPDLIILDVNMPKMNGLEFYGKISTLDGRSKYPVLMLTSEARFEKIFKDIQVDGFMTKSFEANELINKVNELTGENRNPVVFLIDFFDNSWTKKYRLPLNRKDTLSS